MLNSKPVSFSWDIQGNRKNQTIRGSMEVDLTGEVDLH